MVSIVIISRYKSVISFIEYLINWSEEVYPGLEFSLWVISLSFSRNKCYIFSFWRHIVCIRAAKQIPCSIKGLIGLVIIYATW